MHYAITNLSERFPHSAAERVQRLQADVRRWTAQDVAFVQLREKGLDAGELFELTRAAMAVLQEDTGGHRPQLLVNGRPDVAIAAGADGVHLTTHAGELRPDQVREVFREARRTHCTVSISCHTLDEVAIARRSAADLVLFGPVFGKVVRGAEVRAGTGLGLLQQTCRLAHPVPVLALGGVTPEKEALCRTAGAKGLAGIRLFA